MGNAVYFALSRPAWGVALSLMTLALYFETKEGDASVVKRWLSLSVWQVVGNLTYVMYLVHLVVLGWWGADVVVPPYYSGWFIMVLFLGVWMVTAMLALFLHLVMEAPINGLVSLGLKKMGKEGCYGGKKRKGGKEEQMLAGIQLQENKEEYSQMADFNIVKA